MMKGAERCLQCGKRVYPMEKVVCDSKVLHKQCLRCSHCNKQLSLGNYASLEGQFFCKPHFKQLFQLKGNYSEGFGKKKQQHAWEEKKRAAVGGGEANLSLGDEEKKKQQQRAVHAQENEANRDSFRKRMEEQRKAKEAQEEEKKAKEEEERKEQYRKKREEMAKREEERKRTEAEERKRKEDRKRLEEERRRKEEEERRSRAAAAEKKRLQEEEQKRQKEKEEKERRQKQEEEKKKRNAEEKKKRDAEEKARMEREEQARQERLRKEKDEARKQREEEERARREKEESARRDMEASRRKKEEQDRKQKADAEVEERARKEAELRQKAEEEVADLRQQLDASEGKVQLKTTQISVLEDKVISLEKLQKATEKEVAEQKAQRTAAVRDNDEILASLESVKEKLDTERAKSAAAAAAARAESESFQKALEEEKAQRERLAKELQELKEGQEKAAGKAQADASSELKTVQNELEALQSEGDDLRSRLETMRSKVRVAQDHACEEEKRSKGLEKEKQALEERVTTLTHANEKKDKELSAALAHMGQGVSAKEKDAHIASLSKEVQELESELEDADRQHKEATTKFEKLIDSLMAKSEKLQASLKETVEELEEVKDHESTLKYRVAELQATIKVKAKSADMDRQEMDDLKKKIASLEKELDETKAQVARSEASMSGVDQEEIKKLKAELEEANEGRARLENVEDDFAMFQEEKTTEVNALKTKLDKTQKELENTNTILADMQVDLKAAQSEASQNREKVEAIRKEKCDLEAKLIANQRRGSKPLDLFKSDGEKGQRLERNLSLRTSEAETLKENVAQMHKILETKQDLIDRRDDIIAKQVKIIEDKDAQIRLLKDGLQESPQVKRASTMRSQSENVGKALAPVSKGKDVRSKSRRMKDTRATIKAEVYQATREWDINGRVKCAVTLFHIAKQEGLLNEEAEPTSTLLMDIPNALYNASLRPSRSKNQVSDSKYEDPKLFWLSYAVSILGLLMDDEKENIDNGKKPRFPSLVVDGGITPQNPRSTLSTQTHVQTFYNEMNRVASELMEAFLRDVVFPKLSLSSMVPADSRVFDSQQGLSPGSMPGEIVCSELGDLMDLAFKYYIYPSIVVQMFCEVFHFINASIFTETMKRGSAMCSPKAGFELKLALSQIQSWVHGVSEGVPKRIFTALGERCLNTASAIARLLVTATNASVFTSRSDIESTFAPLTFAQVQHLLQNYKPDESAPEEVPESVKGLFSGVVSLNPSERRANPHLSIYKCNKVIAMLKAEAEGS
eukprot:CAMPEP_0119155822 /NCGR_PEP_ID=MMETSP1310-20130426/51943_1 /TAXON_ID=464262 /ORGANISM="Genus nov. species nov., Strain RCC2339" /LENGTH=1266 /DNA_ID=CAMNT_0007148427 /DNA_START=44 /DNA_END=3844 /DNA_ORIENTATION=-